MRMPRIATTFFALATVCAANAFAQPVAIKPGLWQLDMTLPASVQGNQMAGMLEMMKKQMASMPPEQRKEMEKMLADMDARGTKITGDGLRTNECFTKENIARFDLMGKKGPDGCTNQATPVAGGVNVSMQCPKQQMKIDAAVKYQGDKAYTFDSTATLPGPDGKMMTQKTTGTGKWLGSDCGKVTPVSANR